MFEKSPASDSQNLWRHGIQYAHSPGVIAQEVRPCGSAWSWRPFWVYPWWIFHPRPVIVVPKPIVVVPIVPRAHLPKELPWRFREHQARPKRR